MSPDAYTAGGTYEKMATEWYYQIMNDVIGPLTSSQLVDRVRSGQVKEDTLIRKDDSQWVTASQVNGLFDAAKRTGAHRVCPYCGHKVDRPPTTCRGCNRQLVLSVSSRLTSMGNSQAQRIKAMRDRNAAGRIAREKSDRSDIVRYSILLLVWIGLLFVVPNVLYSAMTGKLLFAGEFAVISVGVVSLIIGAIYYVLSRLT